MWMKFNAGGRAELHATEMMAGFVAGNPDIPPQRSGWNGSSIVDLGHVTTFYIDPAGQKNPLQGDPSWPRLTCNFGDELLRTDDGGWRVKTDSDERAARQQARCKALILAALSDATQKNLTAYAADLALKSKLSADEKADVETMRAARGWIMDMLAACRDAVTTGVDPVWPPVPAGVPELAARF